MMDLFSFFVDNVFGGFWMSVVGLSAIMFMIMALGAVSSFSILTFIILFLLSMTIGYGYPLITIPIVIFILSWSIFQFYNWLERGGGG